MFDAYVLAAVLMVNKPEIHTCHNPLVRHLQDAGFHGQNLKEAWAIAMRESGGNPKAISATGDYGLFQINRAAHQDSPLWREGKMLNATYNAQVAAHFSQKGRDWSAWDISGDGKWLGRYTPRSVYNKFVGWLSKYPC